jgi:hypothetical protein
VGYPSLVLSEAVERAWTYGEDAGRLSVAGGSDDCVEGRRQLSRPERGAAELEASRTDVFVLSGWPARMKRQKRKEQPVGVTWSDFVGSAPALMVVDEVGEPCRGEMNAHFDLSFRLPGRQ